MKTILVIFILNLLTKDGSCNINQCPNIIEFKSDVNEDFALITILASKVKSGLNLLKVKLELRGDLTGAGDNTLKLVKSKDEVVADIMQGKRIQFKLNFLQSSLSPIITKISVNDTDICKAVKGFGEYKFDVLSPFILPPLSTPTPNATSQLSAANTSSVQAGDVSWLQALPFAGSCGKAFEATETIIGGEVVAEGEYPWMVAMYHYLPEPEGSKKFVCGASLISDMYVITAAHCTKDQTLVHLEFGKYNIDNDYETHSVSRTSWKIIPHPDYKNAAHGDVALVSFYPLKEFTEWIVPICLWGNFDSESHPGIIAGWGQQDNNVLSQSITPMKLRISMVNLTICRNADLTLEKYATNKTFCAGGNKTGPCHGDSGGGFFVTHGNAEHLRGIISHSVGTSERCNVEVYAVFADLTYALAWMRPYLTADSVGVSVAAQKCEEYKQLRANIGKSSPEGTNVSQYPHMALLGYGNPVLWACTGTLISKQFILTTALCLHFYDYDNVSTAHLGFLDKGNRNKSGTLQTFKIIQTYKHPTFKNPRQYADIGLLKLDRPVEYTKAVVPACLHEDVNIPIKDIEEIGWEWEIDAAESQLLQVTDVTLRNDAECASAYGVNSLYPKGIDAASQFCAEGKGRSCDDEFRGFRYGKSIQIHDTSSTPKIIGILSSDLTCTRPALYTRVTYYVPWIESIVWPGASGH